MAATDFIVAIELGSSRITGIAGKKHPDGSIQVLALASEQSSDGIRKGVIYNLDKTAQSLTSIIKKLESTLKAKIGQVYVGVGGQSLRTIRNTEVRHLDEETKISQELIDSLLDSNREVPIIDQEILEVAPQEYKVGNNLLADPVGVPSDHIEGRFLNIIARNAVKQNIDKCFIQAGIEIADYLISPLELANAVLTNAEKRSGCTFIDFGADTTTVSVWKNNILRHLAVIPLGGSNITKDICSLQIEEEDAEELKLKYAKAYTEIQNEAEGVTYALKGRCNIEAKVLEEIVEARVNEIIDNVWNQIDLSGYASQLLAGAIITGGAANLKELEKAFSKRTKMEKIRMARETHLTPKGIELKKDGSQNLILALLSAGKENCYREISETLFPVDKEKPGNEADEAKKRVKAAAEEAAREAATKAEAEKKKKEECEKLIKAAEERKGTKDFNKALDLLKKAKSLGIAERYDQIRNLEEEVKQLKSENSIFKKLGEKMGDLFTSVLEDDK